MSYEQFQKTSDSELNKIFCIPKERELSAKQKYLEDHLPEICKALSKKGMTTLKQWEFYIKENPSGYGLTQFRLATQRYRMVNNPSMRMEHKAGARGCVFMTSLRGMMRVAMNLSDWRTTPTSGGLCSNTGM